MANFVNKSKSSTNFANQPKTSDSNRTWDESVTSWDDQGQSTWDLILASYVKQSKNIASYSNQSKN